MNSKKNRLVKYLFVIQWILLSAIIFYLSHQNKIQFLPSSILQYDKVLHFIAYFTYGISTFTMLYTVKRTERKIIHIGLVLSVLFAISDEIHQFFVPGRMMDFYDFIADLLGILFSILFFHLILKRKLKQFLNIGKK